MTGIPQERTSLRRRPMPSALAVDTRGAAAALSLSERTIARLVASGQLPSFTVGEKSRRFSVEALRHWVREQSEKGGEE
ncbi:MAG: helix-turn-helix domain-containing protein [Phycisphaerales bacterium]|nr:helix-turn-helix domain-containing protein [Phycisphaerales bacterium]